MVLKRNIILEALYLVKDEVVIRFVDNPITSFNPKH